MTTVTLPSSTPSSNPRITGDEKALIILCHLSGFLGVGFILPLVVFLIKKALTPFMVDNFFFYYFYEN